ncbi:Pericentriolar material 1 protein [Rhynchospora pubera]|uniref:Pericentriolar material 1 protein n=1 Tax=Rhynchospora pubera TaxID=906938 RepID=A0AAV8ESW1_9POAL|nr:Pericentriolar material 1 protein [Rhynchospora pubera]KAJ4808336.1 Pericentriolar material 1 protein [Rhynchospora pubera]
MALISNALRQAFLPKQQRETFGEENRAWSRLKKPLILSISLLLLISVLIPAIISLRIVHPAEPSKRPFCRARRRLEEALPVNSTGQPELYRSQGGMFYVTEEEAADFYWLVVFLPSAIVFFASALYLVSGMVVAYTAPRRHFLLLVVENGFCASRRGGVRCLSIINSIFAIVFGLLALFLGSSLLTLGSSCSVALFWCYEIAAWSLVILYGGTACFLKRKAVLVLDEGNYAGHNLGLEMLEGINEVTPEMERRINDGFKQWMGSSLLSSDDEEESPDDYLQHSDPTFGLPDDLRV